MRRVALLSAVLMLSAIWVFAQYGSSQNNSQSSQTGTATSSTQSRANRANGRNQTSLTGCLEGSSGNFSLVGRNGKTYQLQGNDNELGKHLGQEITITGTTLAGSAAMNQRNQGGMAGQASQQNESASTQGSTGSSHSAANPSSSTSTAFSTGNAGLVKVTGIKRVSSTCSMTK